MMRRVKREAALLQAVSDDDAAEVSLVLGTSESGEVGRDQQELFQLRVKATFNDPKDPTAFFHSIASYGMEFALNENITQLAHRNEKMESYQLLLALEKRLGLSAREDLDLEAKMLTALAGDQGDEVSQLLRAGGEALLNLQVKETYKDPHDRTAFYHSVASYGLKFELGDTLHSLAVRNERRSAAQSLQSFHEPEARPLDVLVTNAVNGQELCRISAMSTWTLLDVAKEVAVKAPAPGCRVFLLGGAALTTGTTLANLSGEERQLELSSLVRSNVDGVYTATVAPTEEDDLVPLLAGRGRLGRRGRRSPKHFLMELKEDGTACFEYSERPIDLGHCAPPSGGILISGTGTWSFEGPGLKLVINDGDVGHFMRSIPKRDRKLEQPFTVFLTMVKEDQLDVVNFLQGDEAPGSDRLSFFQRICCPTGTAFVKSPEGRKGTRSLVGFR